MEMASAELMRENPVLIELFIFHIAYYFKQLNRSHLTQFETIYTNTNCIHSKITVSLR